MIEVKNFTKFYDETQAVDDLSFAIEPGTILGMVGQNGAGKTTTLRTIAGILPPSNGQVMVDGKDVVKESIAAKKVLAYIPDEPRLFEALTVWEHLMFYASAYQVESWEETANELLTQFEMTGKKDSTAGELSRGMRQKVAICCGFLYEPKAVLFDEPHTGLDPQGIRNMKDSIVDRAEKGSSVIVSSHLLSLIEGVCTHLIIMAQGRKQFFGSIEQLREKHPGLGDDHSLEEIFFRETSKSQSME